MLTAVKERPILFSGEMVRAILDGRKTQTRRVVKPQAPFCPTDEDLDIEWAIGNLKCPYGKPSEILWVRELWTSLFDSVDRKDVYLYAADDDNTIQQTCGVSKKLLKWKPSIHMPRAASRILLEITDVRIQRIQDISEEDAIAEGVDHGVFTNLGNFKELWNSINDARGYGWDLNPWVWCVSFKRLEP